MEDISEVIQKELDLYYADNAKKLHHVVDQIFYKKYGGVAGRDMDIFYSVANDVFTDIWYYERYDSSKGEFGGFLYVALEMAIIDELKRQTRDKRTTKVEIEVEINGETKKKRIPVPDVYMDKPIGEDGVGTMRDMFASDFDLEKESGLLADERIEKYLSVLSVKQKKIAKMIMAGYNQTEIRNSLRISERQFISALKDMKTFEKSGILKYQEYVQIGEDKPMQETYIQTTTFEKSKPDKLSISSIIRRINNCTIRFDHPLQRASEQWSPAMKGNLISDILQGNPIPALVFAEQIVNNIAIIWDLDGKQRCTNVYSFHNDGYKITKNVRRWNIKYQATVCDKEKKPILDEKGFPQSEKREFDIRGKKFSDLPEELRYKILDYNFEITQYLNCSSDDIAYHIARYNEGKPMTASQKGITRLGEEFASMVKSISGMPFFKEMGGYKVSEGNNGTINRVVVESVMSANFLCDWKKKQEDMCEYMKDNAVSENFENFEDMVERISKIGNEEVFNMFDSKDSFLWFGLFARFTNTGLGDEKFVEFMAEFNQSLHNEKIDGVSFDGLCVNSNGKVSSTKDKQIVIGKIKHLENLMNKFLNIEIIETQNEVYIENVNEIDVKQFIIDNIGISPVELEQDMDFYENSLDKLIENTIRIESKLRDQENRLSLLAIMAFSYKEDVDLEEWLEGYARDNNTYFLNQKKNYLHMKANLKAFVQTLRKGKQQQIA